jgi:hypothetical protein
MNCEARVKEMKIEQSRSVAAAICPDGTSSATPFPE